MPSKPKQFFRKTFNQARDAILPKSRPASRAPTISATATSPTVIPNDSQAVRLPGTDTANADEVNGRQVVIKNQSPDVIFPPSRPFIPQSSDQHEPLHPMEPAQQSLDLPETGSTNEIGERQIAEHQSQDASLPTFHPSVQQSSRQPEPVPPLQLSLDPLVTTPADKVSERKVVVGAQSQDTSHPSIQQPSGQPEPDASVRLKKVWGVTKSGLETALRLLEKSSDAFPPLKSAVGGLVAVLDLAQAVGDNHEEYQRLGTELTNMANTLAPYATRLVAEDVSGSVALIIESINTEVKEILKQQDRSKITRIVEANQDQGDVLQRYRRIESLFRQLQSDISLRTWDETRRLREMTLLENMPRVDDALYNSSYSTTVHRRECTAETHEEIFKDLRGWAKNSTGAKVYWMNGKARTGKTTIAYSFCKWLEEQGQLGGNFFCSRISASCRDVKNIVPSLVHQLAQYSPAFRSAVCKILEKEPQASQLNSEQQFRKLVREPMQAVKAAIPENVVVVIDALDECEEGEAFQLFLKTLLRHAADLPIRLFLTSRPEPRINGKMLVLAVSLRFILRLPDIKESPRGGGGARAAGYHVK